VIRDFKLNNRSHSPTLKYLLCRPQGGLNDMLCQIEKCCRYAEKTNRIVVIDTNYKNSENFHDDFSLYFSSRQKKLRLTIDDIGLNLENLSVFPHSLSGKLNTYQTAIKKPFQPFYEAQSNEAITFNFASNYQEDLLVSHQGAHGSLSLFALLRLKITKPLQAELFKRLSLIGGAYVSIHIRHTDYRSDYTSIVEALIKSPPKRLFVASDNQNVVDEIIEKMPHTKIFSFSNNLSQDSHPIHFKNNKDKSLNFERNRDAIIDLIMLGMSSHLVLCKISRGITTEKKPEYSGFSLLAKLLHENKIVINHLLYDSTTRIGLE